MARKRVNPIFSRYTLGATPLDYYQHLCGTSTPKFKSIGFGQASQNGFRVYDTSAAGGLPGSGYSCYMGLFPPAFIDIDARVYID